MLFAGSYQLRRFPSRSCSCIMHELSSSGWNPKHSCSYRQQICPLSHNFPWAGLWLLLVATKCRSTVQHLTEEFHALNGWRSGRRQWCIHGHNQAMVADLEWLSRLEEKSLGDQWISSLLKFQKLGRVVTSSYSDLRRWGPKLMLSVMATNNVSVQPSLIESLLLFHFSTEIFPRSDSKKHYLDFFSIPGKLRLVWLNPVHPVCISIFILINPIVKGLICYK